VNGPNHYTEAERLLDVAQAKAQEAGGGPLAGDVMAYLVLRAQAHATLALAAATVAAAPTGVDADTADQWDTALADPYGVA
jgi:hypothetical protein